MSKKAIRRIGIAIKFSGPILACVGFFWLIGTAGESDFESVAGEILHPESWYWIQGIIGVALFGIGVWLINNGRWIYRAIKEYNNQRIIDNFEELILDAMRRD